MLVNARTCKHFKELLGDKYEAARIKMKKPDGLPPKGAKGVKAAPKAKAKAAPEAKVVRAKATPAKAESKRKKRGDDDDDDDDDVQEGNEDQEEEDEDTKLPPAKRGRKAATPVKTAKGKEKEEDGEEEEGDDGGDDKEAPAGKSVPKFLLANKWNLDTGLDPTGWRISEKLDGVQYALPFALLSHIR